MPYGWSNSYMWYLRYVSVKDNRNDLKYEVFNMNIMIAYLDK